jgi:ABC-type glycerol-3-phosphate transport system permease component
MKPQKLHLFLYTILTVYGIISVLPFIWMLLSSFKLNREIMSVTPTFFPRDFTTFNYPHVFERFKFLVFFRNSLFLAVTRTAIVIYTSSLCGYVLAKHTFKGRDVLFGWILATMMIPWPVTIIPMYSLMLSFGWLNSYLAIIVPSLLSGFGIFLMRQFIMGIPMELVEAGRIDGASEFYIFHRIILPLSKNAISAIGIFHFLWYWEDFLWPFLVLTDESKQVLAVGLQLFSQRYGTDFGGLFAATTMGIIPVLTVYILFQKRFIEGMAMTGLKA